MAVGRVYSSGDAEFISWSYIWDNYVFVWREFFASSVEVAFRIESFGYIVNLFTAVDVAGTKFATIVSTERIASISNVIATLSSSFSLTDSDIVFDYESDRFLLLYYWE